MSAAQLARLSGFALLALQVVWHGLLAPATVIAPWQVSLLYALPILPAVLLWLAGHRQAGFWGSVAALGYFSHGIMEAWAAPASRPQALLQTGLALVLIFAANWTGLQAKLTRRKA